ncbi:MAG: fumarylacetoacetate hydrolase family protein [Oscillospiraceae bacterium]|nr:fumarylacetoacetate hydrolase family protein [Oscillospiraceae bacterium]
MSRYVRFSHHGQTRYGRLSGDTVYPLLGDLFACRDEDGTTLPLSEVALLPPCRPTKLLCVGFNYRDHAEEFDLPVPAKPNIFIKPLSALTGPEQPVRFPKALAHQVDYEAELVIVVGRRARHVALEDAADYILGYTIGNDVTARDLQEKTGQWTVCKGFDTFAPIGPWIETAVDPREGLDISAWVNGQRRQHSNTKHLIFDAHYLVHYLSQVMTLEPGDVIFTGTPSGIGPVQPGDVMEMRIQGIGSLCNPVEAEA